MSIKTLGVIIAAISSTLAAHGAVVQYGVRRQEAMLREMRATLEPLRADVARAHSRLDGHLAWHGSTPQ